MIDHSLAISPMGALVFHLKQGFWLYAWPMLIGFVTILGYQMLGRLVMMGTTRWPLVFAVASMVSMMSLFGWITMVRSMEMIPLYGSGVGLASAMMSRVYAVITPVHPKLKIRIIRVIWRGDTIGIEQLHEALRVRAATKTGKAAEAKMELAGARV